MSQVKLTRKGITVLIILISIISFGLGYGIWKVTGAPYLSSQDSEAGGGVKEERNIRKEKLERCRCSDGGGVASCGNWCVEKDLPKDKSDKPEKICGCTSFENGCGVNCWFPGGTSAAVKAKAKADDSCQRYIAMCDPSGTAVTYEIFKPGHKCWGKEEQCKNPVGEPNCACDGGGLIDNESRVTMTVGETIAFCGYAYDADGINVDNINIRVDGTVVGKATVTDACTNPSDPICVQYKNKKPVKWCYNYTSTTEGDKLLSASWKDLKGYGGDSCKATLELSAAVVQDNWIVDKNAARSCIEGNNSQLNYTISIRNSAEDVKEVSKIVDTLDSKVKSSHIRLETIKPNATVVGNIITWEFSGEDAKFEPGETKIFSYSLLIPKEDFGTYNNIAVITPVGSDSNIEVEETVIASCDAPNTAIFESARSKIVVGVFLVLVAFLYAYIDPMNTGVARLIRKSLAKMSPEARVYRSRERFEKRVVS